MHLKPGDHLGPYEILAAIGKGGMGEVFKARDTRLHRDVAIKVSAQRFSERFEREARVIASLNHPNICTLYDIGPNYLVMEYIEGDSPKGPLPVETVLDYARQMADALDLAHEKGVTHRDLKPANLKITPEGKLKVLDFGLAKITQPRTEAPGEDSPTLTMGMTEVGMILGTAAYMAPEQAKGKVVDKRADIWAFGVVLYEISTGKRLFKGEDMADVLASVLKEEPNFDAVPARLRPLLKKCLEKEPRKRLRDIADAMELTAEQVPVVVEQLSAPSRSRFSVWAGWTAWAGWVAAGIVAAAAAYLYFTRPEPQPSLRKIAIAAPANAGFDPGGVPMVSPDGRTVAFKAVVGGTPGLWVREPDSLEPRLLPGTQGANLPFWSPDSKSLAFFADNKLKRIAVAGGPPITLCDGGTGRGGTWNSDGVIVFSPGGTSLLRVSESGGTPTPLTKLDTAAGETVHRSPWFLPDGRHFLFTVLNTDPNKNAIYLGDLEAPVAPRSPLVLASSTAVYAWPGYLLFVRDQTLLAQPMDASSGKLTGDAVPVAEHVDISVTAALAQFSASQTGVLVYASNGGVGGESELVWWDRNGNHKGKIGAPTAGESWVISPDGNSIALSRVDRTSRFKGIWRFDLLKGFESPLLTDSDSSTVVWSPDGSRIAAGRFLGGGVSILQKAVLGSGAAEVLDKDASAPLDWHGDFLVESRAAVQTLTDVWVLPLTGDKKAYPYASTGGQELNARVSPDGKWLAYESDESKTFQVYVDTFPKPTGKRQVSPNGARRPVWSRDGKELYFVTVPDYKLMAVPVKAGSVFDWDAPKPLFTMPSLQNLPYDVHPDGRFLIPVPVASASNSNTPITMVLDWYAALKK